MAQQIDRKTGHSNEQSNDALSFDQVWTETSFMPSGESYSQMKSRVLAALEQVEMGIDALSGS